MGNNVSPAPPYPFLRSLPRNSKVFTGTGQHGTTDLILCQKREVEKDFEGLCIRSHHNEFRNTAVETLGRCADERRNRIFLPVLKHKARASKT